MTRWPNGYAMRERNRNTGVFDVLRGCEVLLTGTWDECAQFIRKATNAEVRP